MDVGCHLNVVLPGLDDPRLEQTLTALAGFGYTRVVLPPIDPGSSPLGEWAAQFQAAGLVPTPIVGQSPGSDVSSDYDEERRRGEQVLQAMVDATVELGGDQLNGVPYGLFGRTAAAPDRAAFERSAQSVGRVAEYARDHGVTLTLEVLNRYETAMVNTAEQARDFVECSGSGSLRIHLDTFHMAIEEADPEEAIRTTAPLLGYLELGQSGRGPLATGSVDIAAAVRAALGAGYTGPIGVEAFSRAVLPSEAGDFLAIWREPYSDGLLLAEEAIALIRSASEWPGERH